MQNRLREGRTTAWSRWDILGEKIHLPREEIDRRDRSQRKPFRRRTARATPSRLIRDFGTPEVEAQTTRWAQPLGERDPPQPPPELPPWQSILPPLGKVSETLPARFQEEQMPPPNHGDRDAQLLVVDLLGLGGDQGRRTSIVPLDTLPDGGDLLRDSLPIPHNNH